MENWFEELSSMRKKFVESAKENNFHKGIRHSTVEKYPDTLSYLLIILFFNIMANLLQGLTSGTLLALETVINHKKLTRLVVSVLASNRSTLLQIDQKFIPY